MVVLLNLKNSNLKSCFYRCYFKNLIVAADQKSTTDTHKQKQKESKHNTKFSHQNARGRRWKDVQKTNPKQLTKLEYRIHIEFTGSEGDSNLIPGLKRSPRDKNGNPLTVFLFLKNSMERGAWRAAVLGVAGVWQHWATIIHTHNDNYLKWWFKSQQKGKDWLNG